jgi:hypothetical protein
LSTTLSLPGIDRVVGLAPRIQRILNRNVGEASKGLIKETHFGSSIPVVLNSSPMAGGVVRYAFNRVLTPNRVDPALRYRGGIPIQAGVSFPDREGLKRVKNSASDIDGSIAEYTYHCASASQIEFIIKGQSGYYRVLVNGRPISQAASDSGSSGSLRYVNVSLPAAGTYRLRFECTGIFYGIVHNSNGWVTLDGAVTEEDALGFGDSIADGTGGAKDPPGSQTFWPGSFSTILFESLGMNPHSLGSGGTGYVNPGIVSGRVNAITRYNSDIVPNASRYKFVLFALGTNDTAYSPSLVQSSAEELYDLHLSSVPSDCLTIVLGNFMFSSSPTSAQLNTEAAIQAAASSRGIPFISMRYAYVNSLGDLLGVAPSSVNPFDTSPAGHPNYLGHHRAAAHILQQMKKLGDF